MFPHVLGNHPFFQREKPAELADLLHPQAVDHRLDPLDREMFLAALEHGLKAAGATAKVLSDQAIEMLFRASRGIFRVAARLVRSALRIAQERGQTFLAEPMIQLAIDEMGVK